MIGTIPMIVMGIFVAANILVVKWKLEHDRYADAILDATLLVLVGWVFSGSISGLMIGTIASSLISMYLLLDPPDALIEKIKSETQSKKPKAKRKPRSRNARPQP